MVSVKYILAQKDKSSELRNKLDCLRDRIVKRICRYVFNDSKSAGLRPDRNDYELNVQEEIQKVYAPKTR